MEVILQGLHEEGKGRAALQAAGAQDAPDPLTPGLTGFSPRALRGLPVLHSLSLQPTAEGLELNLVWEARRAFDVRQIVAIHLMDAEGKVLAQCDYASDEFAAVAGETWRERTVIPTAKLARCTRMGLAVGVKNRTLTIDRGTRDWDGHRLLLDLPAAR